MTHPDPDDIDVSYHGALSPDLPCPLLYLTTEDVHARDYLIPVVKRYGLPLMSIDGDPDDASLIVKPARGDAWRVLVDSHGLSLTVEWPGPRSLVYGGAMDTLGWPQAAIRAGECWLLVGPPRTWGDQATMGQVFGHVWESGGAFGVVPVSRAMWTAGPTAQ